MGSVNLDDQAARLGIQRNVSYSLDIFQAERHTTESTFRLEGDTHDRDGSARASTGQWSRRHGRADPAPRGRAARVSAAADPTISSPARSRRTSSW
jgi:hypothetical protein